MRGRLRLTMRPLINQLPLISAGRQAHWAGGNVRLVSQCSCLLAQPIALVHR